MRALAIGIVTVIGLAGMVGAGFWAAQHGATGSWLVAPTSLAMATAVLALGLTWSLPGDPRRDARWQRRSRMTLIGCASSAVGNGVWVGALLGTQGAHPLLAMLAALAVPGYVALAVLVGERLRRLEERRPQALHRSGPRPLVVGIASGAVLAGAMQFGLGRADGSDPLDVLPLSAQLVVLGALGGTLMRAFPLSFAVNRALGTDPAVRRSISRAVLRGRQVPDEHREAAARYAAIGRRAQAWLLTMLVLIYVMSTMTQLRSLFAGENEPWPLTMLIGLTAVYAVCLPLASRQQRRLARYSDAHPVPSAQPA